jgi:hypothetical protein
MLQAMVGRRRRTSDRTFIVNAKDIKKDNKMRWNNEMVK